MISTIAIIVIGATGNFFKNFKNLFINIVEIQNRREQDC